jgi:hypothetical protein
MHHTCAGTHYVFHITVYGAPPHYLPFFPFLTTVTTLSLHVTHPHPPPHTVLPSILPISPPSTTLVYHNQHAYVKYAVLFTTFLLPITPYTTYFVITFTLISQFCAIFARGNYTHHIHSGVGRALGGHGATRTRCARHGVQYGEFSPLEHLTKS